MNVVVEAKIRELGKKSDLRKLRLDDSIPAVIYRKGQDSIPVALNETNFLTEYHKAIGEIAFFVIKLDGKEYKTVIKEKQIHPVSRKFVHIDFQELLPGEAITLDLPLKFTGEAHGLKEGGKLEILVRKIKITCKPEDIPQEVVLDTTPLGVGESIHFSDLKLKNANSSIPGNTVLVQVKGAKVVAAD